jgi:ADP-ribose pyrophosphatase
VICVRKHKIQSGREVKTLHTRKIYSGREISIRIDKFNLNNKTIEKEIVEHMQSIGLIPVIDGMSILFVTQYRRAAGRTMLEIPAGKIEKGESPKQAAIREMREEIGYTGKLFPLLQWYLAPGYDTELMYIFVARDLRKINVKQNLDIDENIKVRRISLTEAIRKCFNGEIKDCKTIAALLAYARIYPSEATI